MESDSGRGFTLPEVLVALAVGSFLMAAVFAVYRVQRKSALNQEDLAAAQQSLRAAAYMLEREIRMAGCDPTGAAGAGFLVAETARVRFTMDILGGGSDGQDNDGDGFVDEADESGLSDGDTLDTGEDVTYGLYDSGGDGDLDLGRKTGSGSNQPVAENIDALNFVYLDQNHLVIDEDGNGNVTSRLADIRAVQVTVVARSRQPDPEYVDTRAYSNLQGDEVLPPQNDHFRRRVLKKEILCRNL